MDQALRRFSSVSACSSIFCSSGWTEVVLPLDPALALLDDVPYVAIGTSTWCEESLCFDQGLNTRHVEVYRVDWPPGGEATWSLAHSIQVFDGVGPDVTNPLARLEHPALVATGDGLHLAASAYSDVLGNTVILSSSTDGATWTDWIAVDESQRVIGVQTPTWSTDGTLHWARLSTADTVEICRYKVSERVVTCQDTGGAAVRGIAASMTEAKVGVADSAGTWSLVTLEW